MTTATDSLKNGALYRQLVRVLPIFVKNPFNADADLDVRKLQEAAGKSHEAVYKWLRKSKLTPENATLLVNLANQPENVDILSKLDRTPPTIRDFDSFVYGAA